MHLRGITEKCLSLDMIENGGNVMAGKGFEINDLLPYSGDNHRSEARLCQVDFSQPMQHLL